MKCGPGGSQIYVLSWNFSPEEKRQKFRLCLETDCRAEGREEGLAGPCDGAARVCPKENQP